ncbi:N-acetyl mannosamine transferase [Metarhizobium album]|uniref:N-acetyl mannosamine transferase n=1 Tax=Metarhizobium album TaxID=2182425 RepID=A0A2U2DWX7_9HYPH|nr:WecB/TagA/CpsF family glycosyltransferase [Rhizobium album]PWE57828.1 N-acetyl mannosamine transferase [Rhizobium album]
MNLAANFSMLASRRSLFGLSVCDCGWSSALAFLNDLACLPLGQTVVSFLNANNANLMIADGEYRQALSRHLVLPDGIGVDLASRVFHGAPFPANLNGTDFVPALLTYMTHSMRIGLVGARREVLERAAANLRAHAPWHEVVAISDGFFDKENSQEVVSEIERQGLDILIVGMGTPLQEKWVDAHIRPKHARLVLTVGAYFDFAAGVVPRAPSLVRRLRLEWAYRLLLEPRRLGRRYLIGIPLFLCNLLRYRFGRVSDMTVPLERPAMVPLPPLTDFDDGAAEIQAPKAAAGSGR